LSQSLTGLESEKSGFERKSATRSRRSTEKLVDTSIVARPELMPEKSESGKKPLTKSLMPASTEELVDTSIVAKPELVSEKFESGKKPIARARRSTENLDASTSGDPIEVLFESFFNMPKFLFVLANSTCCLSVDCCIKEKASYEKVQ
jgi:hypothetical protein